MSEYRRYAIGFDGRLAKAYKRGKERVPVSKIAEFLNSIMEELAANEEDREEIEAKAIFLLLNYCPPEEFTPQTEETPLSRRRP